MFLTLKQEFMKKLVLLACCLALGLGAHAQKKGQQAFGVNLSYADDFETAGFGVKYQYNFTKRVRGEGAFDYFFKHKGLKAWDLNANVHYLFPLDRKFTLYPLAGMTLVHLSGWGDSNSSFGINLGGGGSYEIDSKWRANIEMKYQAFDGGGQFVPSIGLAYKF